MRERTSVTASDLPQADVLGASKAEVVADSAQGELDELEGRLADALDGSEELSTLVKSTLRRAREILGETHTLLTSDAIETARRVLDDATGEKDRAVERKAALARLLARDVTEWELEEVFADLRGALERTAGERASALREELPPAVTRSLDDWFQSDESLEALMSERLIPTLKEARYDVVRAIAKALHGGWKPSPGSFGERIVQDFEVAGIDPLVHHVPVDQGLANLYAAPPLRPLDVEAIGVRAGFGDRLLLRSQRRVRRRLFGPPEAPSRIVPTSVKEKRLTEDVRNRMKENANGRVDGFLADLVKRCASEGATLQAHAFVGSLRGDAEKRADALEEPLLELSERIESLERMQNLAGELSRLRAETAERLEELAARFGRAELDVLVPSVRPIHFADSKPVEEEPATREPAPVSAPVANRETDDPFAK